MVDRAAYSCLLDESEALSIDPLRRNEAKAHLVFSALTQSAHVLSDNQLVAAQNLRALVRNDRLIRDLVESGLLKVSCRVVDLDGNNETEPTSLADTQAAFIKNGKLPEDDAFFSIHHEFDFVEKFGIIEGWSYKALNAGYEEAVKGIFQGEVFQRILNESDHKQLLDIVLERGSKPNQLGRQFLTHEIFELAKLRGIVVDKKLSEAVAAARTAPYVTNLPTINGYSPIYSDAQSGHFNLVRGRPEMEFDETTALGDHKILRSDYREYGLCNLEIENVLWLRETDTFKKYQKLKDDGATTEAELFAISEAHVELQVLIENLLLLTHKWSKTAAVSDEVIKRFERRGRISIRDGFEGDFLSFGINSIPDLTFPAAGMARSIILEAHRRLAKKAPQEVLDERDKRVLDSAVERDVRSIGRSGRVVAFELIEPEEAPNEVVLPMGDS